MTGSCLGDGWEMAGITLVVLEHQIQQRPSVQHKTYSTHNTPTKWLGGLLLLFQKNGCESKSLADGWEMAGRWLGHARAISKDFRCNMKSLQDGLEMTGWLAPTNSKYFGWSCRSPRDGWEMAGRFALAISKESGCHFGSLGNGWENTSCIRTFNTNERPFVQHKAIQYK